MLRQVPLPPGGAERATALLEGRLVAPAPRDAATVLVLRDGVRGLETFLLRRRASMAFAAGMHVFPGGAVDPRDGGADVPWAGPPPAWWARALDVAEPLARALVHAAVRETFEECGVLLAGPSPEAVVEDVADPAWEEARRALEAREVAMGDLLADRGLVLRADLLRPFAHWVTPGFEERRYDTRFFLAALPAGQRARDLQGESDRAAWVPVADAARDGRSGAAPMLPPTLVCLEALAGAGSVADALAAPRDVRRVEPRAVRRGGAVVLEVDLP